MMSARGRAPMRDLPPRRSQQRELACHNVVVRALSPSMTSQATRLPLSVLAVACRKATETDAPSPSLTQRLNATRTEG